MKSLVIIPTYNENYSVTPLVGELLKLPFDVDILFIDDNSTDGTQEQINELKLNHPNISIINRPEKMGLASAYIQGFKYALANGYENIIQMDGDLSHQPEYLKVFFSKINKTDFVIGSRYIKGGGVSNWSKMRKSISFIGNLYARSILGININDFTGGYNLWKKEVLLALDLDQIKANGYSFLIELKYRAIQKGFGFLEVPIVFVERSFGKSKMKISIIIEAIWRVWQFRLTNTIDKGYREV